MIDILNKLNILQKSISQNKNEEKSDNDQFDRVRRLFDDYTSLIDQLKINLASKIKETEKSDIIVETPCEKSKNLLTENEMTAINKVLISPVIEEKKEG